MPQLAAGGASFVGANCGTGIETFVGIAKAFQACAGGATGAAMGSGPASAAGGRLVSAGCGPASLGACPAPGGGSLSAALPIWIKGNAGQPQVDSAGNVRYNAGPEIFAAVVPPLLAAGARFIGGCCGSTPEHIRAIAKALASRGDRLKIDA